jgi:hypothetical protein
MFRKKICFFLLPMTFACAQPIQREKDGSCPIPLEGTWIVDFKSFRSSCSEDKPGPSYQTISYDEANNQATFVKNVYDQETCSAEIKGTSAGTNLEGEYSYISPKKFYYVGKWSTSECYGDAEISFRFVKGL